MDTKQPLSLFLVAILAASVFTLVGVSSLPVQKAVAQGVTIETSADELGGTFYGESFLQVIIEDPNKDDDDSVETISVSVEVDPDSGSSGGSTFDVPETSTSSSRFEFFLIHEDSDNIDETDLDPIAAAPFVVVFGPDGAAAAIIENETITADVTLGAEDAAINIDTGTVDVDVDYAQDAGVLNLDRDLFGSTSLVYIRITDQDSNNDPTHADSFNVVNADLDGGNSTFLFDLTGGAFGGSLNFTETGDNTAEFEAIVQLIDPLSGGDNEIEPATDTLTLELFDHADYADIPDADGDVVEDSTDTSEVSFEIDDSDGEIDDFGVLTFGTELIATVRDDDQNVDSEDDDTIVDGLRVVVLGAAGADVEFVDLEENGDNTGVFEIDLSNSELRITFLDDAGVPVANNSILELRAADIEEDLRISYFDPLDDDSAASTVSQFDVALDLTPGTISAPNEVGVTDEIPATITDADLNDNPRTKDSYVWELTGPSPFTLQRGGLDLADIYELEIQVDGEDVDFGIEDVSVTMSETQVNSGVFEFEIDVDDINDFGDGGGSLDIGDGDTVNLNILDHMADVADPDEDDVDITIGRPSAGLDFSRTVVPPPPDAGSPRILDLGDTVVVTMTLVDPILNNQTAVEQVYDFTIGDDAHEFLIEVEDADGFGDCALADGDDLTDCPLDGALTLDDVLTIGDLEETGKNTGVFEIDLEFIADTSDSGDWQNAEFTFTYFDEEGEEESAGFTFRGNDGFVTVDQPSAKTGVETTITVEDHDLDLDDGGVDQFDSNDVGGLLTVETEDDDIGGVSDETFEETGESTGVFTATFIVGEDIPLVDVAAGDQATNILITYDDDLDSTGGGGDEIEVNLPVVSSTGSIQVTPDLVGPATTLTVLIVDADLDEDADSVDEWTEVELDGAVEFSSSRNEVNEAGPDIEETGPNTGVFMFELELITDAEDCANDDLSDGKYEATGGDTDSTIGACPGDLIAIRYEDERTGSGGGAAVSEVIEVRSWDPEFVADQDSYNVNDRVTITISDPDQNQDPDIADSLTDIRVTSDSDRVGEELSAIETGRDTGVFRLSFGTTSGTAGGAITVKTGDDVTIRYTDEFPADFAEEEEDKDFEFVIHIGAAGAVGTTTVTPPRLQDVSGRDIDEVSRGQQVILATDVINNEASATPFVALIEVRDDTNVTVFLAWQTGTLQANARTNVGLSWTPEISGDYTVRTFVISDLESPDILSEVSTTEITVN